jgi:hypothetical protein
MFITIILIIIISYIKYSHQLLGLFLSPMLSDIALPEKLLHIAPPALHVLAAHCSARAAGLRQLQAQGWPWRRADGPVPCQNMGSMVPLFIYRKRPFIVDLPIKNGDFPWLC